MVLDGKVTKLKCIAIFILLAAVLTGCKKSAGELAAEQLELGQRYLEELKYEEAIIAFSKVIELEPSEIRAYTALVTAYARSGKADEAQQIVTEVMERFGVNDTQNEAVYWEEFLAVTGIYYDTQGDMENGMKFWEWVVSMEPGNEEYAQKLKQCQTVLAEDYRKEANGYAAAEDLEQAASGDDRENAARDNKNDSLVNGMLNDNTYKKAYKNLLSETTHTKYGLYDIDKDGIPELLLSDQFFKEFEVYTFKQGDVINLGVIWSKYSLYGYDNNGLLITDGGTGVWNCHRVYLENNVLMRDDTIYLGRERMAATEDGTYIHNGLEISEEEYNRIENQIYDREINGRDVSDISLLEDADFSGGMSIYGISGTQEETEAFKETEAQKEPSHEEVIQYIRDIYYGIQEGKIPVKLYGSSDTYEGYSDDNGVRKISLKPDETGRRDDYREFYYDEQEQLVFAFIYKGSDYERRYYFYNRLLYRYIDENGKIYDYESGIDPYEAEGDAGEIILSAGMEIHYANGP